MTLRHNEELNEEETQTVLNECQMTLFSNIYFFKLLTDKCVNTKLTTHLSTKCVLCIYIKSSIQILYFTIIAQYWLETGTNSSVISQWNLNKLTAQWNIDINCQISSLLIYRKTQNFLYKTTMFPYLRHVCYLISDLV